jgi:hypothetical protein
VNTPPALINRKSKYPPNTSNTPNSIPSSNTSNSGSSNISNESTPIIHKEELELEIEVVDYIELKCARNIHLSFDVTITIQDVLNQLAVEQDIFVDDDYQLFYNKDKLSKKKTLLEYRLPPKVQL